jgi:hypothetical protein
MMAPKLSVERSHALHRLFQKPALFQEIAKDFTSTVSDDNLRYWLVKRDFTPDAAAKAAKAYLESYRLAKDVTTDYDSASKEKDEVEEKGSERGLDRENGAPPPPPPPPPPAVKVGDYVQWISSGVEQFKPARRVIGIFPDGKHVQVFGSNTGVPMSEAVVVDKPPLASPMGNLPRIDSGSAWGQDENEFNVLLQTNGRLQITADVDLDGLEELRASLNDYESILKRRIAARKPKQDAAEASKKDEDAR